jgi:hypothetical protein
MGRTCKGICERYKINKPCGTGRYSVGQKRCNHCNIFVKWDGIFCPCCGCRLRLKPRNGKYKEKYFEMIEKNNEAIIGKL